MADQKQQFDFDFIIVGSGFGGSVSAHRLSEKGYKVAVMEMGRRWKPEDLPRTSWTLHRWFWRPKLGLRGFFNMRLFRHVTVYHGCAVGGGSITYGATLLRPPAEVWDSGTWARLDDWRGTMAQHYATAEHMLGIVENQILGPADHLLKKTADATGCGNSFYRTRVGIFQPAEAESGRSFDDPFFSKQGPPRGACVGCGGCIMGCRYGAKNTLDLNYLYLAEKHGAKVFPETKVVDVKPLDGSPDGASGYGVHTVRSTAWIRRRPQQFTCRAVVFTASALGTMELLFRLRQKGSLPAISAQLGKHVRTNSESLIGARMPGSVADYSGGISIGSGVYIDEHTHIEAVRYPRGSDTMGLLTTALTDGSPGAGRIALWARNIVTSLLRHPITSWRMARPWGWARETVILLCMQALDGEIEMDWRRPWFWPFRKILVSRGKKVPAYIPQANRFARKFAEIAGGTGMSTLPEILFDVPGTAHCIGGSVIADSATHGVVDSQQRVFGYRNMYICDGSVIAANLGVNPSLTITALAERAMSFVPAKTHGSSHSDGHACGAAEVGK